MKKIDIICACSDLGVHINGSQLGPEILINNIDKKNINQLNIIKYNQLYKKELDVNNIDLSNFIIDQEVKDKIVETAVLRATISNYLITNDLGVVIPKIKGTIDEIQVVGSDTLHNSITKDELESNDIGCSSTDYTCSGAPSFIYETSYWSGSASNAGDVWFVSSFGTFGSNVYNSAISRGVRPVIIISKSNF